MEQLIDNRYEIVRPLGSGGMAEVFLAHDKVLDRDVALKVMNSRYASDDEFVERFRREAQSAAALSHPNIVSIYDRGVSDEGTYYIAMEYLPGGTLKDRILKKGALPPKTAAQVAIQIAEALRAAHGRGVVHRDIKPHNILITESGDIKVTDFGIARAASSSTMTKTGAVMGTAHYISPEQAMGEPVGPASDLYSLGVLFYEMLTGELPFDADTPIGIAMKHVNGNLRPPREINPAVPAGLNAIVVKLLQKDPNDRYGSDAELIEDLERTSRGETPAGAAVTQAMSRLGPPAESTTRAMPSPVRSREPQRKKRGRLLPILLLGILLLALLGFGGYSLLQSLSGPDPQARQLDVPDLSGDTLEEAQRQVGDRFEIVERDTQDGPEQAGTILDQDPASGGKLAEASEIQVTTASGRNAVPNVVNSSQDDAQRALSEAGFANAQVQQRESDAGQEGVVLSQDPDGGSTEDLGQTVAITVGTGPNTVAVPDIPTGSTQDESAAALEQANLTLGDVSTTSSDVDEGGIMDQTPDPGTQVEEGSSVDIVLSSGPEKVEVPDVTGQQVATAQQTMVNAGLGQTAVETQSTEPAGTVISTDPGAGAPVEAGTTVTITYSLGTQQAPAASEPSSGTTVNPQSGQSGQSGQSEQSGQSGQSEQPSREGGGSSSSSGQPDTATQNNNNDNPAESLAEDILQPNSGGGPGSADRREGG